MRLKTQIKCFQYISDLHLESNKLCKFPIISNNLVLAGDIGDPFKDNYYEWLKYCSYNYENTFLISGNHEYHRKPMIEVDNKINNIVSNFSNVHYLKNRIIETNNHFILGCTLWSNRQSYNHIKDVFWLKNNIETLKKDIIVITHYIPTYKMIHEKFLKSDNLDYFYSHLDYLIKPPVVVWISGHSHCTMERTINGVDLRINALGHDCQNIIFKIKKIFLKN